MTIINELKEMKFDCEKWAHILNNKDKVAILLDSDWTGIILKEATDEDEYTSFDDWIGHDYGLASLFLALGVKAIRV